MIEARRAQRDEPRAVCMQLFEDVFVEAVVDEGANRCEALREDGGLRIEMRFRKVQRDAEGFVRLAEGIGVVLAGAEKNELRVRVWIRGGVWRRSGRQRVRYGTRAGPNSGKRERQCVVAAPAAPVPTEAG
ncbi:hypothetical protein BG57_15040 [Caballeronia grimmiae]|uniref:Uncharacterized protein n=1 Tax=Caballeronia grimmiae TaxID=1071679 RepID=A0A069NPK2_9BURK|nr:hypothetical protein BG57_15040 [Caballeronia grimmiae]GGD57149.1 hypothetical protein GCM10010985_08680 [Caballeronia grimmiae]